MPSTPLAVAPSRSATNKALGASDQTDTKQAYSRESHGARQADTGSSWRRALGLRPVRFALTGATAGLVQLALLHALETLGCAPIVANALAFLLAAQANFFLSQAFTWGDRAGGDRLNAMMRWRWIRYHGSIAGTAGLNMVIFALAHPLVADVLASALGIGVAALANFLIADRYVFRAWDERQCLSRRGWDIRSRCDAIVHLGRYGSSAFRQSFRPRARRQESWPSRPGFRATTDSPSSAT